MATGEELPTTAKLLNKARVKDFMVCAVQWNAKEFLKVRVRNKRRDEALYISGPAPASAIIRLDFTVPKHLSSGNAFHISSGVPKDSMGVV